MFWRRKQVKLKAPDGAERRRAIEELVQNLKHPKVERQYQAVAELAKIAHPMAVEWLQRHVTHEDTAERSVRLLEEIVTNFPEAVESASLHFLSKLHNPLQKLTGPLDTWAGRSLPPTWKNLLSIDCSSLREKAAAELQRRAQLELEWRRKEEQLKKQREAEADKRRMA